MDKENPTMRTIEGTASLEFYCLLYRTVIYIRTYGSLIEAYRSFYQDPILVTRIASNLFIF